MKGSKHLYTPGGMAILFISFYSVSRSGSLFPYD